MTVTVIKSKAKSKQANVGVADQVSAVAHEYVRNRLALEAKLAKLAALQKAVAEGEAALLAYVDMQTAADAGKTLTVGGYVVKVGPKGRKATQFDNEAIKKELGVKLFDTLATFKIEDLKKYMTGNAFDAAVTYEHVNKRKVVIEEAQNDA